MWAPRDGLRAPQRVPAGPGGLFALRCGLPACGTAVSTGLRAAPGPPPPPHRGTGKVWRGVPRRARGSLLGCSAPRLAGAGARRARCPRPPPPPPPPRGLCPASPPSRLGFGDVLGGLPARSGVSGAAVPPSGAEEMLRRTCGGEQAGAALRRAGKESRAPGPGGAPVGPRGPGGAPAPPPEGARSSLPRPVPAAPCRGGAVGSGGKRLVPEGRGFTFAKCLLSISGRLC